LPWVNRRQEVTCPCAPRTGVGQESPDPTAGTPGPAVVVPPESPYTTPWCGEAAFVGSERCGDDCGGGLGRRTLEPPDCVCAGEKFATMKVDERRRKDAKVMRLYLAGATGESPLLSPPGFRVGLFGARFS
jgi:hypothetical protein